MRTCIAVPSRTDVNAGEVALAGLEWLEELLRQVRQMQRSPVTPDARRLGA
jgi:hypothetical protein